MIPTLSRAEDDQSIWQAACDLYDQGQYSKAIENYNNLLNRGLESPELYYNLGNSYYKSKMLGMAVWAYRQSLLIDPEFKPSLTNLQYARDANIDQIQSVNRGFISDIWSFSTRLLSMNEYLLLFTISWMAIGLMIAAIFIRKPYSNWTYYLLIVSAVIAIFSATASIDQIFKVKSRWGVMIRDSAEIREGPGFDFEKVEVIHDGLELKLISEREGNFLIELGNGLRGWVDKRAIIEI